MVLEIIIFKFSCILKIMSRNTFPESQPDSASYPAHFHITVIYVFVCCAYMAPKTCEEKGGPYLLCQL